MARIKQSSARGPLRGLLFAAAVAVLGACTGENLFTFPGTSTEVGPKVTLTAPTSGFTIAVGDSILVVADVNAPTGGGQVEYRGTYASDNLTRAYVTEPANMNGINSASLVTYLQPEVGQTPGEVYITVQVADLAGVVGADSVLITIN